MPRQQSGGRSGARMSAVGAPETSPMVPSREHQDTRLVASSKRQKDKAVDADEGLCGLIVTATPIGNLSDVTLRVLEILREVDVIACEDTRITRRLLDRYNIPTPTLTYHDHNAARVRPRLIERLSNGESIALVSDAGTPLISDPGFKLVRAAIDADIPVSTLPGPTAMVSALVVSGLPTHRFLFGGFLPSKPAARRRFLEGIRIVDATLVFYESARRLPATLADMGKLLGNRDVAVARELTKIHEEIIRGSMEELVDRFGPGNPPRGEIVIVVGPPTAENLDNDDLDQMLCNALSTYSLRNAVDYVTAETGLPRRKVYRQALALSNKGTS